MAGLARGEGSERPNTDGEGVASLVLLAARCASRDQGRACHVLSRSGVAGEGIAAFLAALALLRVATRGTLSFLPPAAPLVSRDESLLIEALAGLQRGAPWLAQRAVAEWLAPDLAVRAVALLAKAAAGLARAGLTLKSAPSSPPRQGLA